MKIALVGAGRIAQFHYDAFVEAGANVTSVCTRGESGKEFATKNNIQYFDNIDKQLQSDNPDAVLLLTQPSSYETLLKSLKTLDKPVFLEKPVSYSFKEGVALKELLPSRVMVGQNRRFYSNVLKVKELIDSIPEITAHFFVCERAKDIKIRPEKDRNYWHTMNAIHGVDLMKFLFGTPENVISMDRWGELDFSSLKKFNSCVYENTKNHRIHFHSNFDSPGGWRIHIFYKETEITFFPIEQTTLKNYQGVTEIENDPLDSQFKQGFVAQAKCFLEGCQSENLPDNWVTYDDALDSVELTEKIFGTL